MSHMGNSGKTAVGAVFAALGALVLTAVTLEEAALFAFLGAVAVGYVASVAESFARRRYLALLAGGIGTSLSIGCSIAFLRMWGLAFNQDAGALGEAVTTRDSDIYFYLAAASGSLTLVVLFAGAVWPPAGGCGRGPASRPGSGPCPCVNAAAGRQAAGRRTAIPCDRPAPSTPAHSGGTHFRGAPSHVAHGYAAAGRAADRGTPPACIPPAWPAGGSAEDIRLRNVSLDSCRPDAPPLSGRWNDWAAAETTGRPLKPRRAAGETRLGAAGGLGHRKTLSACQPLPTWRLPVNRPLPRL
ncbi:hypothetical protein B1A87_014975 [Arthrobacter sp. KBS0703]|uniref:hypothetical protein n=1 Tax=Arthrobacter sp. KBS0703 TaxID=1955698 RepID=UPI001186C507|nr:hypothetical protein [Arthrobacter sp. KBS0703]TSE16926.1 hypothetical protein B1A87_014975 [Arthrobacter sp. KBS0703]